MRDRGKTVEIFASSNGNNNFTDFNFSVSSDIPCKKHPSSFSVGICPQCLKDRLVKLVCSECVEQRLSSCSCSDISPFSDQGRMAAKVQWEKAEAAEEVIMLRRSSSSCVEIKKSSNGFWKIKRLFFGRIKRGRRRGERFSKTKMTTGCSTKCSCRDRAPCAASGMKGRISTDSPAPRFRMSPAGCCSPPQKSGFRGGEGEKGNFPFPRSEFLSKRAISTPWMNMSSLT